MSMNDHGWGNKPDPGGNKGGGPPDLEELWRDVNRRLSALFGKKGGGFGGGGGDARPPFNMRQFGGGIGLLLILVAVIWLASGFYIVDASQRGVVLQVWSLRKPPTWSAFAFAVAGQSHEIVNLSGVTVIAIAMQRRTRF